MDTIQSVTYLDNFRLLIKFFSGSSLTVDLSKKIKTARYADLSNSSIFQDVTTDGEMILWKKGTIKVPLYELIDVAVGTL